MARRGDIDIAFRAAIKTEMSGRRVVRTEDFCRELANRNWYWSQREANRWIKSYQPFFFDTSDYEGENKKWALRNMGTVK